MSKRSRNLTVAFDANRIAAELGIPVQDIVLAHSLGLLPRANVTASGRWVWPEEALHKIDMAIRGLEMPKDWICPETGQVYEET